MECEKIMSVSELASDAISENGNSGKNVVVAVRKAETEKIPYSKVMYLEIPGQRIAPDHGVVSISRTTKKFSVMISDASTEKLYQYAQSDNWPECLNHCDTLAANFLIGKDGDMSLIDWEDSGQGDTAQDLGSFIACSDLSFNEAVVVIEEYLGHKPSVEELRHYLAYTAIASYCWYLWAIYQEANSVDTGNFLKMWYDYSYLYYNKSIELYRINQN